MRTVRSTLPIWVRVLGWTAVVYGLLWTMTWVLALREMRALEEAVVGVGQFERMSKFDPLAPAARPPAETRQVFLGNLRCPCPFVWSMDVVQRTASSGQAHRSTMLGVGHWHRVLSQAPYWRY